MIIQPSHSHTHQEPYATRSRPPSRSGHGDDNQASILQTMLRNSVGALDREAAQQIEQSRRFYQQKVYLSYCQDASQYLMHMLHKSHNPNSEQVAELVLGRQSKVVAAIKRDIYEVKVNRQDQKIKQIKDELTGKISQMKLNFSKLDTHSPFRPEQNSQKVDQLYKGLMEFRQKGYWNDKSERALQVKQFVSKMRRQKRKMQENRSQNVKKLEESIKDGIEKEKKQGEQQQKRIFQEASVKRQKMKNQRQKKLEQNLKRLSDAKMFLLKYSSEKPMYVLKEQQFKKQVVQPLEEEKRRKLKEIKKSRRPIDSEQLQLHEQRYEQFKSRLIEAYERRQQDKQLHDKNMEKLKQLYHGHFHEKIEQQMKDYQSLLERKRKQREMIFSYSAGVKQEFKPKIDQRKREEIQQAIRLMSLKDLQRGKIKVTNQDGTVSFEQLSPHHHKVLGVSYLEQLKKLNEGKKRRQSEERSLSLLQLSKKKVVYPDYLKQIRTMSRVQSSTNSSKKPWERVLQDDSYSSRDKYASVMDHVSLLEHEAKQKQMELRYVRNETKALQLKQRLDKCYLESVAAKMQVLKEVVLKQ